MPKRRNSGTFTPETRAKIPGRGPSKRTVMLDAIRSVCKDEKDFLEQVVQIGLGKKGDAPNPQVLSLALQRLEPPLKPVSPTVSFDFDAEAPANIQAKQVMKAAAQGDITPDVAKVFLDGLASMLKIEEVTELKDRLEKLEEVLKDK